MNVKLQFGIQNNKLVDIDIVDSGLDCNCVCPSCGQRLIAKKGDIKEHHFAHYGTEECKSAVETALHIYAKNILEKNKRIVLPPVYLDNSEIIIYEATEVIFDSVVLENRIDNIIPDVVVTIKGKPLLIEIAVTHFIDRFKTDRIFELGYSAIEVNVGDIFNSFYNKSFLHNDFEKRLIEGAGFKRWLNNKKQNFIKDKIKTLAISKTIIDSGLYTFPIIVENCPIEVRKWKSGYKHGESYASVYDDCYNCAFGEVVHDKKYFNSGQTVINGAIRSVDCSGHRKLEIKDIIAKFASDGNQLLNTGLNVL